MTNKEQNMAILSKLYEIAEMIWQKMVRNDHGCFRASEIAKNLDKIFYWGDADKDELIQIEVGSFRCEFAAAHIFRLVTKFESLAGIGKKAHQFVYQDENGKEKGYVFFQATKEMAELCDFVYKKQDKEAVTSIFIDAEKKRLVVDGVYDAGKAGNLIDLLQQSCEITTPVVSEKKVVPVVSSFEKAASSSGKKTVSSSEKKVASFSEKKKKSVDDSRKFTFEAVGIEPGDIITFIHGGQRVITIDNNKVVYQGKVYTLSGFCKEFMPDDRRNKANSYRGCAFFACKGVKLDKMFKEALKAKEHADLTQDKEEEEKEIKHPSASVPAAIVKMNVAELLASPSYTRDFKPVCGYFASSPIIVPFGRDKDVGARKNHYLVGVAVQPMPPPGNEKKFLPLQARGARL